MSRSLLRQYEALSRFSSPRSSRYLSSASIVTTPPPPSTPPLSVAKLLESRPSEGNVVVNGFIRSIRKQSKLSFAAIGDGSSLKTLQALLRPDQAEKLSTGAAVTLSGRWKESPNPRAQAHELHVDEVWFLGPADESFPIQKKYQTAEYLRTIPHLRPRIPFNSLMLRFRSRAIASLTQFFAEKEFVQAHTPIITSSDCEGAGEAFNIATDPTGKETESFFRDPKYLTVSSQLHLEALAQSVGKVWTLSPSFRAEKSTTPRHLSEFYMLEAEVNFANRLEEVLVLVEDMLKHLTTSLYESIGQEVIHASKSHISNGEGSVAEQPQELERRWQGIMQSGSWPRITYTQAIKLLQESSEDFDHSPTWGKGLLAEHERFIASTVGQGSPVFVTEYPKSIKPFYMYESDRTPPSDAPTVDCFDLLVPEACEIAGGSMREYRLMNLLDSMQVHGLIRNFDGDIARFLEDEGALKSLKWYVDLRRWGSVPHGGFGLGFDRLLGYLAGVQNIRDVVAFPRWVGRCDC